MAEPIKISVPLTDLSDLGVALAAVPGLAIKFDTSGYSLETQTLTKESRVSFSIALPDWAVILVSVSASASALFGLAKALLDYAAAKAKAASGSSDPKPALPPVQIIVLGTALPLDPKMTPQALADQVAGLLQSQSAGQTSAVQR